MGGNPAGPEIRKGLSQQGRNHPKPHNLEPWVRPGCRLEVLSRRAIWRNCGTGGAIEGSGGTYFPLFENMGLVIRPFLHRHSEGEGGGTENVIQDRLKEYK